MALAHSARRGLATAAGGLVVVGAGATTGVIVADMDATWNDQAALEAAATVAAQPAELAPVRPVVVTLIEERHVTPEPVIVHKKVYRTRIVTGSGGAARPAAPSRPSTPQKATAPSKPQSTQPKPAKPRTIVAPAPKAPAPASGGSGSGTTSKTS
jgi:hypothetical protein